MDDGYTLVFENLEAFQAWREKEEEEKVVEFVKGDTHGSKAVPPRFKDHVKLICARHSRSGRKKYVKKYPERVRKVPSRKLDGTGCQASMSYKTYFDTPEVRVCYVSQHSHDIGLVNLPFTRRGRRAQATAKAVVAGSNSSVPPASPSQPGGSCLQPNQTTGQVGAPMRTQPEITHAFSSSYPHFPSMSMPIPQGFGATTLPATSSAPAPPPVPVPVPAPTPAPHPFPVPSPNQSVATNERERMERERWDRMDVLYQSIRNNARQFEYPAASVAALESVLVRMYFESPIPAPHPQPGPPFTYAPASVPLAHPAPTQQPEQIAVDEGGLSVGTSESEGDEEDEE